MKTFTIGTAAALFAAVMLSGQAQERNQTLEEVGEAVEAVGQEVEQGARRAADEAGRLVDEAGRELRQERREEAREDFREEARDVRGERRPRETRGQSFRRGDQPAERGPGKAVAVLIPVGKSGVTGKVTIERSGQGAVITGVVRGLEPNSKHGFHVHEFGDLSDRQSGKSVGGHFAPEGTPHGRPSDPPEERHVGDLGNIEANDQGVARFEIRDEQIALVGPNSVIGRSFVVHEKEDKFTQPSGDAGDRLAFGTIGIADERN